MNDVLYDFLDNLTIVYLNDIVIYSKGMEDHVIHLSKVLNKLREHELFVERKTWVCEVWDYVPRPLSWGGIDEDGSMKN